MDDLCSYCGQPGTETLVHVSDWITWACHLCAVRQCDPLLAGS